MKKNKLARIDRQKKHAKQRGATLIVTLILSGLVLSISAGLARMVGRDIALVADFLFAEQAYFSAESGAEVALETLNQQPTYHGKIAVDLAVEKTQVELFINNQSEDFFVDLAPYAATKLRLVNISAEKTAPVDLSNLRLATTVDGEHTSQQVLLWGIQCKITTDTIALQGKSGAQKSAKIISWSGQYDAADGSTKQNYSVQNFWQNLEKKSQQQCILSLQNLTEKPMKIQLHGTPMAPLMATVDSKGSSYKREKRIQFQYLQNRLAALFNFGFIHQDKP